MEDKPNPLVEEPDDPIVRAFQHYQQAVKAYRQRHKPPPSGDLHDPQQIGSAERFK